MIYLGSDHGGYKLKETLKRILRKSRIPFRDVGPRRFNSRDDYPPIAARVARAVARDPKHRGILLCRSGVGVCIAANKVKGVRAVLAGDTWIAKRARRDDDANVICLPSERLKPAAAWAVVRAFLRQPFRNAARDRRRLQQIKRLER